MDEGVEMQMPSTVSLSVPYVTQSRLGEGELWRTDSRVKSPFLSCWKPSEVRQEPRAHQGYPESNQSWSRYGFQAAVNLQEVKAEPGDVCPRGQEPEHEEMEQTASRGDACLQ